MSKELEDFVKKKLERIPDSKAKRFFIEYYTVLTSDMVDIRGPIISTPENISHFGKYYIQLGTNGNSWVEQNIYLIFLLEDNSTLDSQRIIDTLFNWLDNPSIDLIGGMQQLQQLIQQERQQQQQQQRWENTNPFNTEFVQNLLNKEFKPPHNSDLLQRYYLLKERGLQEIEATDDQLNSYEEPVWGFPINKSSNPDEPSVYIIIPAADTELQNDFMKWMELVNDSESFRVSQGGQRKRILRKKGRTNRRSTKRRTNKRRKTNKRRR